MNNEIIKQVTSSSSIFIKDKFRMTCQQEHDGNKQLACSDLRSYVKGEGFYWKQSPQRNAMLEKKK